MDPLTTLAISGGIQGLGSLASGIIGSNAAGAAGAAQAEAIREGIAFQKAQKEQYDREVSPYKVAGTEALGNYKSLAAGLTQPEFGYTQKPFEFSQYDNPGTKVAIQRAMQAINESSVARGAAGGGTAKAIANEVGNMALGGYNNAFDQWMRESGMRQGQAESQYGRNLGFQTQKIGMQKDIADTGLGAIQGAGQLGANQAQSIGGMMSGVGAARGNAGLAGAGALTSGISGLGNAVSSGLGAYQAQSNFNDLMNLQNKKLAAGVV